MMKKNGLLLLLTLSGAMAIQGCGGSDDKAEPSSTTPPPPVSVPPPLQKPELIVNGETTITPPINSSFSLEFVNSGDNVTTCDISPEMSNGLELQKIGGTCAILGVPTQAFSSTEYAVTGSNSAGSSQVTVNLTVNQIAPQLASFPASPFELNKQQQFHLTASTLANSGTIEGCAVTPTLPTGLTVSLDNALCTIAGAPSSASSLSEYTLTASNSAGSATATFSLMVNDDSQIKPELTIDGETDFTLPLNQAFTLELINAGDDVENCTISPALPTELQIQKLGGTCVVIGTPTQALKMTTFTVTGSNTAGNSQVELSLKANDFEPILAPLPSDDFDIDDTQIFYLAIKATEESGVITQCTVLPTLPNGLTLTTYNDECVITGLPTTATELKEYTVTASNSGGSATMSFNLIVTESSEYTGDGPDPAAFDYVTSLSESDNPTVTDVALRTTFENEDSVLIIQSKGFPNQITQVRTSANVVLTDENSIAELFELFIDPANGDVQVRLIKQLNYEADAAFYEIDLRLGEEVKTILVRLYNLQQGTEAEPLILSSYEELLSFRNGHFISKLIGFDEISLGGFTNNYQQNIANMHVSLDRDIDASTSATTHWEAMVLHGKIHGNSHVISNLHVNSNGFINNPDRFKFGKIAHIGFDNVRMSHQFFSLVRGNLSHVYISGVVDAYRGRTVHVGPINVTLDHINNVYTNLYIDVGDLNDGQALDRVVVSPLFETMGSSFSVGAAYSNGVIKANLTRSFSTAWIAGLIKGKTFNNSNPNSLLLSAVNFDIEGDGPSPRLFVGGLAGARADIYPEGDTSSTDYQWRFVKNRNNPSVVRHVGVMDRDGNNDGLVDDNAVDPDMTAAGITVAQLKQAATFTGKWIEAGSQFDITEGEYPVLKGMPYPHTQGASWLFGEDPGIAHQRATYDDYLTKP